MRRRLDSLAFRLSGILILVVAGVLGTVTVLQMTLQTRLGQRCAELNGLALSEGLFGALHSTMLTNRRDELAAAVKQIRARSPNLRVRIFNKEGQIAFSSNPAEVGRTLDFEAEACYRCHASDQPIARLPPGERTRSYSVDGHPALGIIRPIDNEPGCGGAGCHPSPKQKRLLGVLDTTLLLTPLERARLETGKLMLAGSAVAVLFIAVVVVVVVRRAVHRPVHALARTLHALGAGDYSARYDQRHATEFNAVGDALNRTARELERANAELTDWAATLERRVEQKTAEVERAHERALHAERLASLGKLAAVVAHEINNPLAGVLTYSKLLRRRVDQRPELAQAWGDSAQILDAIASESKRCGEIVSSLLSFARGAGPSQGPTEVGPIVDRVLFLLHHKMELAAVEARRELAGDTPSAAIAANQLEQVILALCVNAIEAMPEGGTLTVAARRRDDPRGPRLELEVGDTGAGISAEVERQIFEPFFSTKPGEGLGLGLTVVDSIVQQCGGKVTVRSGPGEGTRFVLSLPAQAADGGRDEARDEERDG